MDVGITQQPKTILIYTGQLLMFQPLKLLVQVMIQLYLLSNTQCVLRVVQRTQVKRSHALCQPNTSAIQISFMIVNITRMHQDQVKEAHSGMILPHVTYLFVNNFCNSYGKILCSDWRISQKCNSFHF